jgi:hypothetical protein
LVRLSPYLDSQENARWKAILMRCKGKADNQIQQWMSEMVPQRRADINVTFSPIKSVSAVASFLSCISPHIPEPHPKGVTSGKKNYYVAASQVLVGPVASVARRGCSVAAGSLTYLSAEVRYHLIALIVVRILLSS